MIFVYVSVIFLVFIVSIFVFLWQQKRQSKKITELAGEETIVDLKEVKQEVVGTQNQIEKNEDAAELKPIVEFEEFSLDMKESESVELENEDSLDEDQLDEKFAEYQKFLRENLSFGDDEEGFPSREYFEDREPKKREESDLSDEERDLLLAELLLKKEFDEE